MEQNTLFARFLLKLQSRLPNEKLLIGQPPNAALTVSAKNYETGDIQVWNDVVELTIGIGNMFHCHFDPTVFVNDNISREKAEQQCIDSAVAFVEEFLAERTILYVRYSDGKPGMSGIVNRQNEATIPKNARKFVWSGPIE
ncbi:MAG: hypothetical protein CL608_08135 [Anaerolineaceae bacterium]|nr:hypothetical protein [Anaerolineaceae bacterium]